MNWIVTSVQILFGRALPRDLRADALSLTLAAVAYSVVSAVDAAAVLPSRSPLVFALADLGFTIAAIGAMLTLAGRRHRVSQTLLAMLATGTLLTLPSVLVHWMLQPVDPKADFPLPAQLLLAAMVIWSLVVITRIFRAALDVSAATALTFALTYILADYLLVVVLPAWGTA